MQMGRLAGLRFDIRTPHSVRNGGPFVLICNHQNSYDLITVCGACPEGTVTVGKKSLIWIPLMGQIYWLLGNIMIDRGDSSRANNTLNYAAKTMRKRKLSVWFFPEGTRSYGRGLLPFKTGAFRLAQAANVPVVTVVASSLENKIKLNRWNNGTLVIELSEPEMLDDSRDIKQWSQYFHQQMQEKITQLNQHVAE